MKHVLALLVVALATQLQGQSLEVRGRVMRQDAGSERAVPRTMVTLHRIGTTAGPVDSMPTDAEGRYRFRVANADTGAMYLATSRYSGIAYFAPPVRVSDSLEAAGEIHVFDTTSVAAPLRHVGRHVVVSAPNTNGMREIVEVWELANESARTRVARNGSPVFVAQVPRGARNVRSTQGDFAGRGAEVVGNEVRVVAPLSPGVRQLVVTYELEPDAFPLTVAVAESTTVVEVLLEEAGASVEDPRLKPLGAVPSDGRNFLRFLGNEAAPGPLTIRVAPAGTGSDAWPWLLGLGGLSAAALLWAMRPARRTTAAAPRRQAPDERAALQATLSALSLQLEGTGLEQPERERLEAHRASVQAELDALAGETPPG
ncbi:MAG: hypothetical protein JNL26_03770 [Gemmatimonadetes bacterium]|nr:hypothetical protein [Gemmatimonadota bacterium]